MLNLDASDVCSKKISWGDVQVLTKDFTGTYSRDLDLSRNKSLFELKIRAKSLIRVLEERAPATVPSSFRAALSTVKSPAVFEFIVVYYAGDFYNTMYSQDARDFSEDTWYHRQFEVFRDMYKARDYRLELWACSASDESVRELKRAVVTETAKGGLPLQLSMSYTLWQAH